METFNIRNKDTCPICQSQLELSEYNHNILDQNVTVKNKCISCDYIVSYIRKFEAREVKSF